jgi:hypothetical protein
MIYIYTTTLVAYTLLSFLYAVPSLMEVNKVGAYVYLVSIPLIGAGLIKLICNLNNQENGE